MPKRSNRDKIKCYRRKLRKLEEKEHQNCGRRIIYSTSDSDENTDNEVVQEEKPENAPSNAITPGDDPLNGAGILDETGNLTADPTASEPVSAEITEPGVDATTVSELDPDILSALGEAIEEAPKFGEKIHEKLAQLWLPILRKGLSREIKDNLLKQFSVPENCTLLQAPKLNPEISAAMADPTRFKDKRVESVQQQLGLGITALNRGLSLLLDAETDKVTAIKHLSDSCRILCDLHFIETEARRKFITPSLDKTFLNIVKEVDRDDTLFGNKLSEKIKASKVIEKQGLQIKKALPAPKPTPVIPTQASSSRLRSQVNWSGPPRYSSNRGGRGGPKKPVQVTRKTTQATQSKASTSGKQHVPTQQQ